MSGLQDRMDAAADRRATGAPDGAAFDLLVNPFILLRVTPNASTQAIKEAYEDAIADGVAPAEVLARAQQCLLSPRLRIDAEVGGLLGVDPRLASQVLAKLRSGAGRATLTEEFCELDALPRSNLVAHFGARTPGLEAMLDLLQAQAAIAPDRVVAAIGAAREAAGTAKVDFATIDLALARLAEEQARAVVYASSGRATFATIVGTLVERTLADRHAAAIDRLDLYLRVYGQASASELSRRREAVMAACEAQRQEPARGRPTERIIDALAGWGEIARPLQLYEEYRNRDDAASRESYQHVRNLYIWLCNQNRQFEIAQRLSRACVGLFKHVPGVVAQARQDCSGIEWAGLTEELNQALTRRRDARALALIDRMLERVPDAATETRLRETRGKIVDNRSQRLGKRIVGATVLGLVALVQVVSHLSPTRSSNLPYYVPVMPSQQSAAPSAYGPWLQPSVQKPGVFAPVPTTSYDSGSENKPATGTVTGTRGNLRYCAYQRVRIDAMRTVVKTEVDDNELNRRVEDWRARCDQVRGDTYDQSMIDREVSAARPRLETEGRAIVRRWQEGNVSAPAPCSRPTTLVSGPC